MSALPDTRYRTTIDIVASDGVTVLASSPGTSTSESVSYTTALADSFYVHLYGLTVEDEGDYSIRFTVY